MLNGLTVDRKLLITEGKSWHRRVGVGAAALARVCAGEACARGPCGAAAGSVKGPAAGPGELSRQPWHFDTLRLRSPPRSTILVAASKTLMMPWLALP